MLKLSSTFYNLDIRSLRLGASIGRAKSPIINPHNLTILGWHCIQLGAPGNFILLFNHIRENHDGVIYVNDTTDLSDPTELHRHQDILNLNFELLTKLVRSPSKKIGKVTDYSVDDAGNITKLYVEKSLIKSLASDTLLIDRSQITEVTDSYIMVADGTISESKKSISERLGVAAQSV